ncbi:MAG: RluA family pseudouridine synthase [Deltaproteobacteria bacterium]|nr:RluA family pseudouridine synthase [Deltaproteobacteria bacterium]
MPDLTVTADDGALTILEFLERRIPAAPRSYLRQLLKSGKVTAAAGHPLSERETVTAGAILRLPSSRHLLEYLALPARSERELEILFESREILIVNKGAGLAVHAAPGHEADNLTRRVTDMIRDRGERFRIAPIHRLDLETSGPVLFGKGKKACGELGKLFMAGAVEKLYLALAAGRMEGAAILESAVFAKGKEKEAQTRFRVLAANAAATLLELVLVTGRRHQIRAQLAGAGHPLFGDHRYGGPCPPPLGRLFLHCRKLAFTDPFSGTPVAVELPLPEELARFCQVLNLAAGH